MHVENIFLIPVFQNFAPLRLCAFAPLRLCGFAREFQSIIRKNGDPFGTPFLRGTEVFPSDGSANLWLADAADCAETLLELVDAAFGIDELRESREERMRVGGDACGDDGVFDTIDDFLLLGGFGRFGYETCARGHVNEDDGIVLRVEILFHGSVVFAARTNARSGENGRNGRSVKIFGRLSLRAAPGTACGKRGDVSNRAAHPI
jgi:hypothetical protein